MSCATRDPYSSHEIEFSHITKEVVNGNAVVDFSSITVFITARGEPLNKTDKEQPNTPISEECAVAVRYKAIVEMINDTMYRLFGLLSVCL